jgi:hypothetical protein
MPTLPSRRTPALPTTTATPRWPLRLHDQPRRPCAEARLLPRCLPVLLPSASRSSRAPYWPFPCTTVPFVKLPFVAHYVHALFLFCNQLLSCYNENAGTTLLPRLASLPPSSLVQTFLS